MAENFIEFEQFFEEVLLKTSNVKKGNHVKNVFKPTLFNSIF